MMRRTSLCAVTGVIILGVLSSANADVKRTFVLEAGQVVPPSAAITAGQGSATLNGAETQLSFVVQHGVPNASSATATVRNADWGTNGPVVFTLTYVNSNAFNGTWAIDSNGLAELEAGRLYVQIDSLDYPTGEIRGQIDLNPSPQPGDVIITEIMYNPASQEGDFPNNIFTSNPEWIELFNTTFTDINIGGWYFQDEDVEELAPCDPLQSGTFPDFILRSFQLVVIIPDGTEINGLVPTVADFKTAWGLNETHNVLQLNTNGTTGGAIVGHNLSNNPRNDTLDLNDFPLVGSTWLPCGTFERPDNEVLTVTDGTTVFDVVNYDDDFDLEFFPDWPESTFDGSIALVPADYPNPVPDDFSSYTHLGNDEGSNWVAHTHGDLAGGLRQQVEAGVYGGLDVGSPCYLFGASAGNRAPTAIPQQILMGLDDLDTDIFMQGTDTTRPFFGLLLYIVKSLPKNGTLMDVASNKVITQQDVQGTGYLMPRMPFNQVRYINNGTCGKDTFTFSSHDGLLSSEPRTVELFMQCGDVVMTEIMYNPDSIEANPAQQEWVELYNTTDEAINLEGWYLEDNATRSGDFPAYILGAHSTVVAIPAVADPAEFLAAWAAPYLQITSNGQTLNGGLAGSNLSNAGESLRLVKPGGNVPQVTDAVFYVNGFDDMSWPALSPDGPSIYIKPPNSYDARVNDNPTVWGKSVNGVDGAYLVELTPVYDGDDIGSPGYLPGMLQGNCISFFLGDGNLNFSIDEEDFSHFSLCQTAPQVAKPFNCDCFDWDSDGDVDLQDFAGFQAVYGP